MWEIGHLERKGRLKIKPNVTESLDWMLNRIPLREPRPRIEMIVDYASNVHVCMIQLWALAPP